MTKQLMKDLYDSLCTNSNLTAIVPSNNIKIGWQNEISSFPTITIFQIGGTSKGQLGYNTAAVGSGLVKESFGPQIEIYSRTSTLQNYQILDELNDIMISSGYEKLSDLDIYDDTLGAHRKITRWNKLILNED